MKHTLIHKTVAWLTVILMAVLIVIPCGRTEEAAEEKEIHVVILATSDMHGNIWGFSYEENKETTNNGMARLYTYIQRVREENPVVFLIDGGDDIQGTIMTDDIANKTPDQPHPVMIAMNYMKYDAMTLGNHEFDWGIGTMEKIIGQAKFPVLAANALDKDGKPITGQGWTIVDRGGIRMAVIGVVTPYVPVWDGEKDGVGEITFTAADQAVQTAYEEILKSGSEPDLILVSAHMGEYAEFDEDGGSDSAIRIAEVNPGIDILQAAHMHITVNDSINGIPVVGVRNAGREIARIDITLDTNHRITSIEKTIVDMAEEKPSEALRSIPEIKTAHEAAIAYIRGGESETGKGTPLGSTTARFQPENEIHCIPEGRLRDTAVIDFILKVQLENSGADVTSCALFKDTSDLPEGEITYENIFDIYMYDNTLCRVPVTGKELKQYMEWAASAYNTWKPGDINISFDPEFPVYQHDIFGGVEYEIDLSRPKGERVRNVKFKGKELEDDQMLTLAVSNYRYASNLKPLHLVSGKREWESSGSIRDMIVAYFSQHSPVTPETDNHWRITGINLQEEDPRRAEIVSWINTGCLPVPYEESYNLADYDTLAEKMKTVTETI